MFSVILMFVLLICLFDIVFMSIQTLSGCRLDELAEREFLFVSVISCIAITILLHIKGVI